jgi:1-acyl-sn-glycerol-3-phosphate acyltransferase
MRHVRRAVSIPLVLIALFVALPLAPVLLLIATIFDFAKRRPLLPTLRAGTFVYQMLVLEMCAIVSAFVLWIGFGFGLGFRTAASRRLHGRVQAWWVGQVAAAARRSAHLVFDAPDTNQLTADGPVVVLARHASYPDAILPALLFGTHRRMTLRYVLANELTWDPALGTYGRRLPNVFVDRKTGGEAQLSAIRTMGAGLEPDGAAIIFPEGQFRTPARHDRAVQRLTESDPAFAERARQLHHLLPPRPAGTLALLESSAKADVVIIGHVGLEMFGTVSDVLRRLPIRTPVTVGAWRIPRSEIPHDADDQLEWLWQQWERLDRWITEHSQLKDKDTT